MQNHVKYDFWTIPIGKAKHDQNPLDGLREELLEECGILVNSSRNLAVKNFVYVRDGHDVKLRAHLFEVLDYSGEIKNMEPHKHRQQIFMSVDRVSKLPYLSDMTLMYLEILGIHRKDRL